MTHDPLASLHLGLSAEAMVLIDPQLADHRPSGQTIQSLMLPAILSVVLMTLIPGMHFAHQGGWRQLARGLECANRCHEPSVITRPMSILSD